MIFYKLGQYLSENEEEVLCWVKKLEAARNDISNRKPLVESFTERDLPLSRVLSEEEKLHSSSFRPTC